MEVEAPTTEVEAPMAGMENGWGLSSGTWLGDLYLPKIAKGSG